MTHHHVPTILVGPTDHLDPEENAMIQAQYSRSYGPVLERLPRTPEEHQTLKEKLAKNYVGYGHKSVGQLGGTSIYFEGVSQLAAKAIEDTKLFNGQESSTRYIDFSNQPMVHFGNQDLIRIQEAFRALYVEALPLVQADLEAAYPFDQLDWGPEADLTAEQWVALKEKRKVTYANTIKAGTFDICRGILPAGVTTNVVFSGTFDLINDHFGQMLHHPSSEMQFIAETALTGLAEKYKYATKGPVKLAHEWSYVTPDYFYPHYHGSSIASPDQVLFGNDSLSRSVTELFKKRKKGQKLAQIICERAPTYTLGGELDFGSFRDLQRHRNGTCLMPKLSPYADINEWYEMKLPESIVERMYGLLRDLQQLLENHRLSDVVVQYACPMGLNVPIHYTCDLNQLIYLCELRTGKTVHQTLRHYMHKVVAEFKAVNHFDTFIEEGKGLFVDMDVENFSLKRGTQTFAPELLQRPESTIVNARPGIYATDIVDQAVMPPEAIDWLVRSGQVLPEGQAAPEFPRYPTVPQDKTS